MQDSIDKTIIWAYAKGILPGGDALAQWTKTMEEATELGVAIANDNRAEVADAIGDIMVTLIIQAEIWGLDPNTCLEDVLAIITKRKGQMVNGVFVKE